VAKLEAHLESANSQQSAVVGRPGSAVAQQRMSATNNYQLVELKDVEDMILGLKLKLQAKGYSNTHVHDFFFKPFQPEGDVSIKSLKSLFEIHGFK
jgi:hypothetical protein